MKKKLVLGIGSIFLVVIGLFASDNSIKETGVFFDREKVVICLDENNAWNDHHQPERDIILEDCASWIVDFR